MYYENDSLWEIKTFDNKIEQNKAQYDLDSQSDKISAISSRNVSKCKFLIDKNLFPGKDFLENSATIIRFEYLSLGKPLKAETDIEKKQYKGLDDTYEFDKIIKIEKPTFKKYNR